MDRWTDGLKARMYIDKAVIAVVNKIARIAWVILVRPLASNRRDDLRFA